MYLFNQAASRMDIGSQSIVFFTHIYLRQK